MVSSAGQSPPNTTGPDHTLVGVINPSTQVVLARPIAQPTDSAGLIDVLRQLWRQSFASDTFAMAATLISTDWDRIEPGIEPTGRPTTTGATVIAGVGVAAGNSGHQPENLCLTDVGDLDTVWLCLLDPVGDTVTVHHGDGSPAAMYRLAD